MIIGPCIGAGLTWWIESLLRQRNSYKDLVARIQMRPPKADRHAASLGCCWIGINPFCEDMNELHILQDG